MLGVGIFPKFNRRRKKASNVPADFFRQVWCMAFAKACQAAGGQRNVFSANFLPPKREGFHGTTGTPAGGQGSSRKHCAIAFRSAAKRPHWKLMWFFPKMCDFALQCWLGGDGGDFEYFCVYVQSCFVKSRLNMFKPRIFHLFPKRINFNHGCNWLKLSRRRSLMAVG